MTHGSENGCKVAVVTGGTRGLGRAISAALAAAGHRVYAIYARNRTAAREFEEYAQQNRLDIRVLRADLTDDDCRKSCIDVIKSQTDHIDVIVHCAASGVHRETTKLSPRHMAWTFNVNVFSFHSLFLELAPMIPSGGRIVGLSSLGASRVFSQYYGCVGASKGALEALFRHYARELAPRGIAVNIVSPGMILTEAIDSFPDRDKQIHDILEATPSGRLATPDEVAGVVEFLACSQAAGQIVGQTIHVDGGRYLY